MTRTRRSGLSHMVTLAAGLALGWALAGSRPALLRAGGGDRFDESILTSGPTSIQYNEGSKVQVAQDGVYYLDYRTGKLLATIPTFRKSLGAARMVDTFAERDLVADFKIDLENGPRPHFLMTTGSMATGSSNAYGEGGAPLFVFESTTRQMAVYRLQQNAIGTVSRPTLDLLEVHPIGKPAPAR
jgi:hypothetical protein